MADGSTNGCPDRRPVGESLRILRGFSACFLPFLRFLRRKILNQIRKAAVATRCGTHRPIRTKRNNRHYTNILRKSAIISHISKEYCANLVILQRNPQYFYKIPHKCAAAYYGSSLNVPEFFPATLNEFLQLFQTADFKFGKNVFGKQKINTPGLFFRGRFGSVCCVTVH